MKCINSFLLFFWCLLFTAHAADPIVDPEVDYITSSFTFKSVSKKDVIIRKDIDLYGNNNPAIFLSPAVGGGKCGQYWTAYVPNQDGFDKFEDVQFRDDSFRAGRVPIYNPEGGILAYYPGKGGGDLMRLQFVNGQVEVAKLRGLDAAKEDDSKLFENLFGRKMDESLPREYFEKPPHQVIDVKEIMARVNAPQITPPTTPTTAQSTPVPTPPAPDQVDKQPPKPSASLTPMAETRSAPSDFPIVPVAIISAVLVGIVFYLLRRKTR